MRRIGRFQGQLLKRYQRQMSASSVSTTTASFDSQNAKGKCPGYYTGDGKENAGIVVIQEWWGVNDQIKAQALKWFNSKGFATVVPDLYRGKIATDHEEAGHMMNDLDWPGAVQDIQGAVNFLKTQGVKKVGVVGFCMGGALSLASAVLVDGVSAASVFYGIPSPQLADPSKVRVPMQLNFGLKDDLVGFSDPTAVKSLKEKLDAANAVYEAFTDYDAGHAFSNTSGPNYHEESATQAEKRAVEFFEKHLAP